MQKNLSKIESVEKRYSGLAGETSSLSCGCSSDYHEVREGFFCADLGCGRGGDVIKLARRAGDSGYVYGIDVSEGMVKKAREAIEESGIRNAEILRSSLEDISLKAEILDIIISNCTINHSDNKERVWKEIFRLLKKGGEFIVNDIYSLEKIPERYSSDPEAVANCWAGAVTRDEYQRSVESAGFINMTISGESSPYRRGEAELVSFTIKGSKPY
jgi:ubiquinone/menaquinone biosynthesis C-methylase UbiE